MKKPDRWERMVLDCPVTAGGHSIYIYDTVRLLRQQHRWMVRLVKKEFSKMEAITLDRTNSNGRIVMAHYKALQCRDILTQLERRVK